MNSSNSKQPSKFTRFLRNNAALLLLIFCVLAITAVVLAVTLSRNKNIVPDDPVSGNPGGEEPGNTEPGNQPTTPSKQKIDVYFSSPLAYTATGLSYTDDKENLFVWKQTLNEWSAHRALDLHAAEGTEVTAMYDGTVLEAKSTYGQGYYVKVDHGEGVVATYSSLKDLEVKAGQTVKKGDVLGYVSTTAECEYKEGPHLHLEVALKGEAVDPTPYVKGEVFRTIEVDA